MRYRIAVLKRHGIRLRDIQRVIRTLRPLPGAKAFLKKLKARSEVVILSDTFYEFADPLMKQLDYPTLLCNSLKVDRKGFIKSHVMRQQNGKGKSVLALLKLNFHVRAAGDSYNYLTMLKAAHQGVLFRPPAAIRKKIQTFSGCEEPHEIVERVNENINVLSFPRKRESKF